MSYLSSDHDLNRSCPPLPWGTFLFVLLVILLIDPFDLAYSGLDVSVTGPGLQEFILRISEGSMERRIGLLLLAFFGVLTFLSRGRAPIRSRGTLSLFILFYLIWALLSVAWSDDVDLTIRRVVILICLSVGAIGLAVRLSPRHIILLTVFVTGTTLIVSIVTEILLATFSPFNEAWRFAGVLHPYGQARNCGLLAIASMALYILAGRKRMIYLLISLCALFFLILTKSRAPFAAALFGLSSSIILTSQHRWKLVVIGVVFFIFIGSLACFTSDRQITALFGRLTSFGRGEEGQESISDFTGRREIWRTVLRYGFREPVLGHGYNAYFTPNYLRRISQVIGYVPSNVHNGYIETFFSLGLVGLFVFLSILCLSIKESIRLMFQNTDYVLTFAVLVWLCSLLMFESITMLRPTFPTLLCMTLLATLGFVRRSTSDD
jgi:O-antigen ligase